MPVPVLITISGTQKFDWDEPETIQLVTQGEYTYEPGLISFSYMETEMTGMEGVTTTFTIENGDRVTLLREGKVHSTMTYLCGEARLSVDRIKGVGISVVGGVDGDVVLFSPQLNWSNVPIRSIAEEIFGLPATVENDCKASLIGECRVQYGRHPPLNISYLAFERTGVGSATIINGNLLRGSDNIAGEVGHITVDPNGMLCDCGRRGCLQTYLTEKFLVQRGMAISPEFNSIMAINDAYGKGDCRVCELFEQVQQQIAMAFNTLMCAYNPDFVIFNDAYYLNTYWKWMQEKSKESESFLFRPLVASLRILPAVLGDTACLYGISCITQDAALARHLEKSIEMMETPDERAEAETRREFQAGKRSIK